MLLNSTAIQIILLSIECFFTQQKFKSFCYQSSASLFNSNSTQFAINWVLLYSTALRIILLSIECFFNHHQFKSCCLQSSIWQIPLWTNSYQFFASYLTLSTWLPVVHILTAHHSSEICYLPPTCKTTTTTTNNNRIQHNVSIYQARQKTCFHLSGCKRDSCNVKIWPSFDRRRLTAVKFEFCIEQISLLT